MHIMDEDEMDSSDLIKQQFPALWRISYRSENQLKNQHHTFGSGSRRRPQDAKTS